MYDDIRDFVKQCWECQKNKSPPLRKAGKLVLFPATRFGEVVAMDLLGPFPETTSGMKFVLVITDKFTRWLECHAIPDQKAETVVAVFLEQFGYRYSCPEKLLTDLGSNFTSKFFKTLVAKMSISKLYTTG